MSDHSATAPAAEAAGWRRWTSPRTLRASLGSGLLGGLCCFAAAITTAAGLGAAGFFTALMEDYQLYFVLASVAVMGFWLVRHVRRQGISPLALRAAAHAVERHAVVMGVVYVVTLGLAMGVAQLVAG